MNRILIPAIASLALAIAACNADRKAEVDEAATPGSTMDQPAQDVPPATAPTTNPPGAPEAPTAPATNLARFDGYGDMRFGMSAEQAKQAWGGELNGNPGDGCYYLNPVANRSAAYFAFMIEDGKFVRYDVSNAKEIAPGGGKVGMTADAIRALYPGIAEQPHKYVERGKYLRAKSPAGDGVVLFETDADGTVTEWRVGVAPQVDYVEGCS